MTARFSILNANPLALPNKFSKLTQAGYKFTNQFLRSQATDYGMLDLVSKLKQCWATGLGYIGSERIDMDFYKSLCQHDRQIIQSSHFVIFNENMIITQL